MVYEARRGIPAVVDCASKCPDGDEVFLIIAVEGFSTITKTTLTIKEDALNN